MSKPFVVNVIKPAVAWLLMACVVWCVPCAVAQEDAEPAAAGESEPQQAADARLGSPEETMFLFLDAMTRLSSSPGDEQRRAAMQDAVACFDFSGVTLPEARVERAGDMLNILNRIVEVRDYHFPRGSADGTLFTYYPQLWIPEHRTIDKLAPGHVIAFTRNDLGEWRFSAETVADIPGFYNDIRGVRAQFGDGEIELTPAVMIRNRVPEALLDAPVLSVAYWQWIGIAIIVFIGFLIDLLVRAVLSGVWKRISRRRGQEPDPEILKRAVRPFGLLAGSVLVFWAIRLLNLPDIPLAVLVTAIKVVLLASGVWAAYRLTDLISDFLTRQAGRTDTKLDDLLVPLLRKTAKVVVTAVGLIYIAESFSIEILPLLTGLGIGGLAFAFAAKDTIENFFGSVSVILDHPFEVGDWIVTNDIEGTVEELGIRSTRVRTFYNSLVTVPNASLVRATVDNYGRRRYRRFKTNIALTYDTPPDKIEAFCEGVREIIRQHPYTRKDSYHVWLNSFGDSSLNVLVYMFHECPDWAVELRERHRFMLDIIRLADQLGVHFAFPTQTIEFKNTDLAEPKPMSTPPTRDAEVTAQRSGIDAARAITADQPWQDTIPGPVRFSSPSTSSHEIRGDSDSGE